MGIQGPQRDIPGHDGHEILVHVGDPFFVFFIIWRVLGGLWHRFEKNAEKVRNQTLQNLENCVPVYTGAQFSFSQRHPQTVQF